MITIKVPIPMYIACSFTLPLIDEYPPLAVHKPNTMRMLGFWMNRHWVSARRLAKGGQDD